VIVIRVVLVEDDRTQIEVLRRAILDDASLRLVAAVASAEEAMATVDWNAVDVLVTDLGLPQASGVDLIARVRAAQPRVQALPLTVHDDAQILFAAIEAGASGYLLKNVGPADVLHAIHDLARGASPISPSIARHLIRAFRRLPAQVGEAQLTAREEQILAFVAEGASHKEIASSLGLSTHTISNHIKNIYAKLRVNRRGDALRKARLLGYLEDPPKP
jgi:DNA-binding NarL/FixJ family response regulator